MSKVSSASRTVSYVVILSFLLLIVSPVASQPQGSSISGRILLSEGKTPVAGAIVKAAEIESKTIYESTPTAENGSYELSGLVEGRYDIAVQLGNGLYVVNRILSVAENESYALSLALQEKKEQEEQKEGEVKEEEKKEGEPVKKEEKEKEKERRLGFWENPLTATGTLIGIAALVSYGVNESTKEKKRPSPF